MADVKISQLTALASASVDVAGDVLAVVDTSATQTKKIAVENLLSPITINKATDVITNLGSVTTVDINGGTIDGAVIGGATPAAGSFTTLTATGARSGDFLTKLTSSNQYGLYVKTTGTTVSHDLLKLDDNTGTVFKVMATGETTI